MCILHTSGYPPHRLLLSWAPGSCRWCQWSPSPPEIFTTLGICALSSPVATQSPGLHTGLSVCLLCYYPSWGAQKRQKRQIRVKLGRGTCFGESLVFLGLLPWVRLEQQGLQVRAVGATGLSPAVALVSSHGTSHLPTHPLILLALPPSRSFHPHVSTLPSVHPCAPPTARPNIHHVFVLLAPHPSHPTTL